MPFSTARRFRSPCSRPPSGAPSGAGLVQRARRHIGERYVNTQVPKDDPDWHGPWDCAEFISWLVYQEAGILYGCVDNNAPPAKADSYTGAWKSDLERLGKRVSVEEAAATVGGIVLRYPPGPGKMGHIAVCDGHGGTIEAKGRRYGVVADSVQGRGWHTGILLPGFSYGTSVPIKVTPPAVVYEVDAPNMDKAVVTQIQQALAAKGFDPGLIDGDFGPNTQAAVLQFQEAEGMVVDGAVGPETAAALGVSLGAQVIAGPAVPMQQDPRPVVGSPDMQQLLPLILMLLSKEKPMATDPAKPGQGPRTVAAAAVAVGAVRQAARYHAIAGRPDRHAAGRAANQHHAGQPHADQPPVPAPVRSATIGAGAGRSHGHAADADAL